MRELELLQHIYTASRGLAPRVRIGPGDDMACLQLDGRQLLAAVDQLIAGRHYDADTTPAALIGRKAIMRSLSDVAAMAGRPSAALATAALPPGFGSDRATELFDAMRAAADEHDCPLIGGDIAVLPRPEDPLVCTVTVLAEPPPGGPVLRGGARVGDTVCVTGRLGGAVEGPLVEGRRHHLSFRPRIDEARALASSLGPRLHAMIDISDGLGRDAAHVARASDVAMEIDAATIPRDEGRPWQRAAAEGEDYELLFCVSGDAPKSIGAAVPITAIGTVTEHGGSNAPRVLFLDGSQRIAGDELGWQHES